METKYRPAFRNRCVGMGKTANRAPQPCRRDWRTGTHESGLDSQGSLRRRSGSNQLPVGA